MNTERIIAIDIVLLPPPKIMNCAIRANHEIANKDTRSFLSKTDHLPHITLLHGFILKTALSRIKNIVENIVRETDPLSLVIDCIQVRSSHGKTEYCFGVGRTEDLQKLHEMIVEGVASYLQKEGNRTTSYILDPNESAVRGSSYEWTRDFLTLHSNTSYDPHISLGLGWKPPLVEVPVLFKATSLAICQLGNYGTCRKILAQWELQ